MNAFKCCNDADGSVHLQSAFMQIVAEHAMLAAHAVAEAEEISRKAGSLLDAANAMEELHHHSLQDRESESSARNNAYTVTWPFCFCAMT